MIPVADIVPENLYSQEDSVFLMGDGFTEEAASEVVCEACRSGDLRATKWRKRWWFTGREFLAWVSRWFGERIDNGDGEEAETRLAPPLRHGDNSSRRLGARSPVNGKEVGT